MLCFYDIFEEGFGKRRNWWSPGFTEILARLSKLIPYLSNRYNVFNPFLMPLGNEPFENTVGKGEIARNIFYQCRELSGIFIKLSSADTFNLDQSKICHLVMG